MDLHDALRISSGVLALLLYVPFVLRALKDGGEGQSFAMWALWAVLDTIMTISLIAQGGNYLLTAGFSIGSIVLAVILLGKGRASWGWFENVILAMVVICLGVWKVSGPKMATFATTVAILLAGIPGAVELWRHPQPAVARLWGGYAVANLLALFGGISWTIEERLAPSAFTLQTLLMLAIGHRRQLSSFISKCLSSRPIRG
jgi:hypothetical protein